MYKKKKHTYKFPPKNVLLNFNVRQNFQTCCRKHLPACVREFVWKKVIWSNLIHIYHLKNYWFNLYVCSSSPDYWKSFCPRCLWKRTKTFIFNILQKNRVLNFLKEKNLSKSILSVIAMLLIWKFLVKVGGEVYCTFT